MRVLLVGGVNQRLHQGPVIWAGHRFEMIPHSFDRVVRFELLTGDDRVTVDPERLKAFVDNTRGYEAVLCESPEALILMHEWKKLGRSPVPLLAVEVHGLKRVAAMRKYYLEQEGRDPWPEMTRAPWIAWIAASSAQGDILREAGVPPEHLHRIHGGTGAYSMILPNADALLDGGPEVYGVASEGLPADGVVIPGTGRRDHECYLRAVRSLPEIPFAVVDEQAPYHRQRLAGTGLVELPNLRWLDPIAVENYIALIKRARLVVVALLPGSGDGGHTTVAIAHRVGAAVICTDVPGIIDYVKDGHNARMVEPGDPDSLAEAIRELWEDPKTRRRLARKGRRTERSRARKCQQGVLRALESVAAALVKQRF